VTVTNQKQARVPQFYLTPAGPCPYLPDHRERKVFARLDGPIAQILSNTLAQAGFRRSQSITYKPSCDGCDACISVRIVVDEFVFSHNRQRILKRNTDLIRRELQPKATREQFALMRTYLDARHASGGMNDMSLFEYAEMVEETPVQTILIEYRKPNANGEELVAAGIVDVLSDGLSMVYSFFHPGMNERSLGTFMILDCVRLAKARNLPHVYLGYWVKDCAKMEYKTRFQPIETLTGNGWEKMDEK
jgi:leucyl-tRNA---protein transferase